MSGAFRERELFFDNLLDQIHSMIEMIWWTGLAPWEFEFPFSGSLISLKVGGVPLNEVAAQELELGASK